MQGSTREYLRGAAQGHLCRQCKEALPCEHEALMEGVQVCGSDVLRFRSWG